MDDSVCVGGEGWGSPSLQDYNVFYKRTALQYAHQGNHNNHHP